MPRSSRNSRPSNSRRPRARSHARCGQRITGIPQGQQSHQFRGYHPPNHPQSRCTLGRSLRPANDDMRRAHRRGQPELDVPAQAGSSMASVRARAARARAPIKIPCVRSDPNTKPPPWKYRSTASPASGGFSQVASTRSSFERPSLTGRHRDAVSPERAERLTDVAPSHHPNGRHHRPRAAGRPYHGL